MLDEIIRGGEIIFIINLEPKEDSGKLIVNIFFLL